MKKVFWIAFFTCIAALILSSCNSGTYAEELKAEKALIKDYIKRNNIKVLSKFPEDSVSFADNEYVQTASGLYFRLNQQGTGRNVERNDRIIARYLEYTLNVHADTANYYDPNVRPEPYIFTFMNSNTACTAFHEAVSYMKKSGAEAELIVPSKIGFYSSTEVIAYGYKFKITFRDNVIPESGNEEGE